MKPTITRPGKPPATRPPNAPGRTAVAGGSRIVNPLQALVDFYLSVVQELRRVTWPTREEWVTATVLTLGLVLVVAAFTGIVDHVVGFLFSLITGDKAR
jgi:preprotein translocase SecE subunit